MGVNSKFDDYMTDNELEISNQSCQQYALQSHTGHSEQPVSFSAQSLPRMQYTQQYAKQSYSGHGHDQQPVVPHSALSLSDASQWYAQQSYTAPYPNCTYASQQYAQQPCTGPAPYPYHAYASQYHQQYAAPQMVQMISHDENRVLVSDIKSWK